MFDETIAEKWKFELLAVPGKEVSQPMADWIIAELQYKAQIFRDTGCISVYSGDVVKSDNAVPFSVRTALNSAVRPLEEVSGKHKDYHPDSDKKVIDLVHPSLFPLVYGRSRVLPDSTISLNDCLASSGKGALIQIPPDDQTNILGQDRPDWSHRSVYSTNFQWLPCEVALSGKHSNVKSDLLLYY